MHQILRTIGQNTGILLLVNIIGSIIGFLMAAALGRGLSDTGFGQYSFVMTWLLSLTLFTEFGLSTVLTRDLAATPENTHIYLLNSLAGKMLLSLPAALIILIFTPQITPNQNPEVILALRWGILFMYSGLFYSSFSAIFKAHQIMTPILWLTLSGQIILFSGTLILLIRQQSLFAIIAWAGFTQSLQCALAFIYYKKRIHPPTSTTHPPPNDEEQIQATPILLNTSPQNLNLSSIKKLIITAWPFALAGFLAILQIRANILILAYLQGDQALGWYAAANRFVETGKQIPGAFYTAMLPALAALANDANKNQQLQKMLYQAKLGLLAFAFAASVGALLLAQFVLTLTYGATYQPATLILQILTFTLIPATQNSLLIIYLYAQGDEKFVNLLMGVGIVINLSLCFWLIPNWGPAGAALALLMAETLLYFLYRQRMAHYQ